MGAPHSGAAAGPHVIAGWVAVWIALSVSIIIVNKHIMFYTGFHFPFLLALWHMAVATLTARGAMATLHIPDEIRQHGTQQLFVQLGATGVLFGAALVAGNASLLFLSVPTIQMLKAAGPATIYLLGVALKTETLALLQAAKVLVVCTGVAIASYGDVTLTAAGLALQVASIAMDAVRCVFLQKVLQHSKVNTTPLVTLAHVAPFAAAALLVPMLVVESPKLARTYEEWRGALPLVALSGALAAALNLVVFKVIRLTSALTTSLSGVIKEWACILVAMYMYGTRVTGLQWVGYSVAICGLLWYQSGRWGRPAAAAKGEAAAAAAAENGKGGGPGDDERRPLNGKGGGGGDMEAGGR